MTVKNLPCCYLPSKVVFLDDNQSFLEGLTIILPPDLYRQAFSSPYRLLEDIDNTHNDNNLVSRCFHDSEEVSLTEANIAIDIREIHKEIFNPKRFQMVSTLVSDYVMPGLNGVDVCRKLQHLPLRKILLTGEAGTDLAVEAFNEGIINQFLLKDSPDFTLALLEAITTNQQQFFQTLSDNIINTVQKTADHALACLQDKVFIDLVNKIINDKKIVEYYLMDTQGSFLMLDKDARPYWLTVKNDTEMQDLMDFARFEEAPNETLNKLATRTYAPYFFTDEDLQTPPADWERFMHKATKLKCDSGNYYYALIDDPQAYELDRSKIVSYAEFLAEHEQQTNNV